MVEVHDYQIVQRKNGAAKVLFKGSIPENSPKDAAISARVLFENNNLTVVPWTECIREDGCWSVELTVPEGGLYRFEAAFNAPFWPSVIKNVCHVGVGELYLITGQSNMAGYGRDFAYDPPQLGVHLYANDGKWKLAVHPLNCSVDTIYPENNETTSAASPSLAFGRTLSGSLGVPVGLVQASPGGSSLAAWHPLEDGVLCRAMMKRIDVVGEVGGVMWYQGCTDANSANPASYLERFTEMVRLWREQLGNIPFVTVQLNRWAGNTSDKNADIGWGLVREAQRQAALKISGLCVVPAIDLYTSDGIHNDASANVVIGERMALAALKCFYGKSGMTAPSVEKAEYVDDTHFYVKFPSEYHVSVMDSLSDGMNVEDKDGLADCLRAEMRREGFLVTTARKYALPAKFHAFWKCVPPAFIPRDINGMPMLSCYNVEIE